MSIVETYEDIYKEQISSLLEDVNKAHSSVEDCVNLTISSIRQHAITDTDSIVSMSLTCDLYYVDELISKCQSLYWELKEIKDEINNTDR